MFANTSPKPYKAVTTGLAAKMRIQSDSLAMNGAELSVKEAQELVEYLKKEKTFKNVSLTYWTIDADNTDSSESKEKAVVNLTEIFRYNSSITSFTISGHYLINTNRLITAFGDVLKHNCVLEKIKFYELTFHHNGLKGLAEGIVINRTLQQLIMGRCISLETRDLNILLNALNENPVLELLFDKQLIQLAEPASKELLLAIQAKSAENKENQLARKQIDAAESKQCEESKSESSKRSRFGF